MDMSMMINIVISLIVLTILIVAAYNYFPRLQKILEEKLKISLFRGESNYGALGQIFYKYKHKSSEDWYEWIRGESGEVKQQAIDKLIAHIDTAPSTWGAITPEAIKVLAKFGDKEHLAILKSTLTVCKRTWKQYKIAPTCYEESCKAMAVINPESAKSIMKEELEKKIANNDDKTMSILNALLEYDKEIDINPLFVSILTDQDERYKARNHAVVIAQTRDQDSAHEAFVEAVKTIAADEGRIMSPDEEKIFEQLFNLITHEIDDDTFELIVDCCSIKHLSKISIKALDLILQSSHDKFSPEQLYTLINLEADELNSIASSLGGIFGLNGEERRMCNYIDITQDVGFEKASVAEETLTKMLEIPPEVRGSYEKLKDVLKNRAMNKQNGEPGGVALTGHADNEKLYLCRAAAAEKRWTFVFGVYEDIINSGSAAKQLLDTINAHKPCMVYLDDVSDLLRNPETAFSKNLKQLSSDPMVFLIATIREEGDIDESGCSVLFNAKNETKVLFPQAMNISSCNDAQKNQVLQAKISQLESNREQEHYEKFTILKPTGDMTPFEFEKFLSKYFRASLLIHGHLIEVGEFEKLDAIDFAGRGVL